MIEDRPRYPTNPEEMQKYLERAIAKLDADFYRATRKRLLVSLGFLLLTATLLIVAIFHWTWWEMTLFGGFCLSFLAEAVTCVQTLTAEKRKNASRNAQRKLDSTS